MSSTASGSSASRDSTPMLGAGVSSTPMEFGEVLPSGVVSIC